jgi:hypothetical protein
MNFIITVPVKSYVRRFLENNYGNPVNFSHHPRENEMFKRMVKKPDLRNEDKYQKEFCQHTHQVEISVTERDFYRHGWELSKTDIVSFGKHFEKNAKWLMRSVVGTYVSFGIPTYMAIAKFQETFKMEEEYWSYESIQKDFFRYKTKHQIEFNQFAYQHLERLILRNLNNVGAVTSALMLEHEKSKELTV